ncbi:unnamed protein product [Camellia sinensis]
MSPIRPTLFAIDGAFHFSYNPSKLIGLGKTCNFGMKQTRILHVKCLKIFPRDNPSTHQTINPMLLKNLCRGGSDLTTTTIGKALGLREIQLWKDVDGVLMCDPNIYALAEPVPYLTFEDMAELVYFGAQSQFEEKFEEINGDEASPSIPLTSGFDGNSAAPMVTEESRNDTEIQGQEDHRLCFDINASQDFVSGIMKIVPKVDSDADYWLLPDGYAEVSHEVKLKAGLFDVGLEDMKRARLQKCSSSLSGPQKGNPSRWAVSGVDPETALYTELWCACAGPLVTVPREGERMFYFSQGHIEQNLKFVDFEELKNFDLNQHLIGHDLCETSSGPDSYPNRSTGHRNSRLSRKVEKEKGASLDLKNIYLHDSKKNDLM